jgi:hypothetical protein
MPFTCAIPIGLPRVEQIAPIPSAGPYYISSWDDPTQLLTVSRNPNYQGPRPQRFDTLEYYFNLNEETAYQQVLSGELDSGPVPAAHVIEVGQLYGPDSPAAARGLQQFFVDPISCVGMLPMNTSRPLFASVNMRRRSTTRSTARRTGTRRGRTRRRRTTSTYRRVCPAMRTSRSTPIIRTSSWRATSRTGIPETLCGRSPSTTARVARSTRPRPRSSART